METLYPFVLPRGYALPNGEVYREGTLRLATAADEIHVLGDPRVKANRAYAVVLLFSRVIERLGELEGDAITPEVVENLFSSDLAYLQDLYRQINGVEATPRVCPHCGKELQSDMSKRPKDTG